MPSKPKLVAISQRVVGIPAYGEFRDCLDQQWAIWLQSLNLLAVPIPNRLSSPEVWIRELRPHGIILSGGNNITFDCYEGSAMEGGVTDAYRERDETETALVDYAVQENVPLLGCCRGMQFLQVYFGGKLSPLEAVPVVHVASTHDVTITNDQLRATVGREVITVNSFHNFGIRAAALAAPLRTLALSAPDQTVEAFDHTTHPIVGIMWHPERANPAAAADIQLATALFSGQWP